MISITSLKEEIDRKTMLKRNQIKSKCYIFIFVSYFFVTIARLREILIVLIENEEVINNNVLDFYCFIYFDLFFKDKFNNVLSIFDVNCNFDKKKARNLREKIR